MKVAHGNVMKRLPAADFLSKYKKIDAAREESKWMERAWRQEYEKDPRKCALALTLAEDQSAQTCWSRHWQPCMQCCELWQA
jgi:hypothetical protein